jgi:hypothetical protein
MEFLDLEAGEESMRDLSEEEREDEEGNREMDGFLVEDGVEEIEMMSGESGQEKSEEERKKEKGRRKKGKNSQKIGKGKKKTEKSSTPRKSRGGKRKDSESESYALHKDSENKKEEVEGKEDIEKEEVVVVDEEMELFGVEVVKPTQPERVKSVFTPCIVRKPVETPEIPEKPELDFFLSIPFEKLPSSLKKNNATVAFHPRQFHAAEVRVFFSIWKKAFPVTELFM